MATVTGLTAERMLAIEASSVVEGRVSDQGRLLLSTRGGSEMDAGNVVGPQGLGPTGTVSMFAGAVAPAEHLLCDGAAVSRTTYANLFNVIGTVYGSGDGFTTFNVPNLKGRIAVGRDDTQPEFDALGEVGGAKTHTLTADEMPSHSHVQNPHNHTQDPHNHTQDPHNHTQDPHNHTQDSHNHTQQAHGHSIIFGTGGAATGDRIPYSASSTTVGSDPDPIIQTTAVNNAATATNQASTATNQAATATNQAATATNQAATATNQPAGGGAAHNNLQPYVVMNYIIRI